MRSSRQRGAFSALELVLVVGATLVVGSLGVSVLQTHHVRAQIGASLHAARAAQDLVAAAFRNQGMPPADLAATGIDDTARAFLVGPYVGSLEVHDGRLDLRFGLAADKAIAGQVLSLMPYETADRQIVWLCGNRSPGVGLEPLGFAGGGPQAKRAATPIEERYLPRECR